jgi:gluconokinase
MGMGQYILSVDIGTSSVRAMIFDKNGKVESSAKVLNETISPQPGWQEQIPDRLYENVIEAIILCIRQSPIPASELSGMGFSSQMYSIFPVDDAGKPLLNSVIWADSRSEQQVEYIRETYGRNYLYPSTGCPLNHIYPLSKVLWIKEKLPDVYERAAKFISIKEYVFQKLTGEYIVDYSCASATGMFNIHTHKWDRKALNIAGFTDESRLSYPVNSTAVFSLENEEFAGRTGLPFRLPVVIGAGDGPLANIGSGCIAEGDANIDLGTSGAARTIAKQPVMDENGRLWCYCLTKDTYAAGGILNTVGNLYGWVSEKIAFYNQEQGEETYSKLNEFAAISQPGANGLYFLPFLLKSSSPYWGSSLKGTLYGLDLSHSIHDVVRAVIEGVVYNLKTILSSIETSLGRHQKIVLTGGLSRAQVWGQIIADVLGREIVIPKHCEGSAAGSAILAMYALGIREDLSSFSSGIDVTIYKPDEENHRLYTSLYKNYLLTCDSIQELGEKLVSPSL